MTSAVILRSRRRRSVESARDRADDLGRPRSEAQNLAVRHVDHPPVDPGWGLSHGRHALYESVDPVYGFQAVGHHDKHVRLRSDERLGCHGLVAFPADLASDVDAADRIDQGVRA